MRIQSAKYGQGEASYNAVGQAKGLRSLVDEFYDQMEALPEALVIRAMHPDDLTESRDKLYCFLSGWMGGPRLYAEKYGSIAIPRAHGHLTIDEQEGKAWLLCMANALDNLAYPDDFKTYLLTQLEVPVQRIRQICSSN